eukprot:TRINITY_DN4407_c0_g1_i1.p1 TRINITY_DN4407_c0_g1~~TRINITY_DN4407_c0_g1_i1.p1  ORF type:complete len:832 (+),score=241.78 TRINITY_DN4407_c0_g1_i1:80-2575(+)
MLVWLGAAALAAAPSMNGEYPGISNGLPGFRAEHRGEWFEVLSDPITTRYSEVYWTSMPPVPLPPDFVARYQGRAVSITGYEADIVQENSSGGYESVPAYESYNHHYVFTLLGSQSKMANLGRRTHRDGVRRHAIEVHPAEWEPRALPNDPNADSLVPTAQLLVQGNGNEHRKSLKHLPRGYGQFLESPTHMALNPMLINTKNPGGKGRGGPLPKARGRDGGGGSMAPPGANYSGLMECPCTTRVTRVLHGYTTVLHGSCAAGKGVGSAQECFNAAAVMVSPLLLNRTLSDAARPAGCFLVANGGAGYEAYFNKPPAAGAPCGSSTPATRSTGSEQDLVSLALDLDGPSGNATITLKGPDGVWFGVGFGAAAMADLPYSIVVSGEGAVSEHKLANHAAGQQLPLTLEIISNTVAPARSPPRMSGHWGEPWGVAPRSPGGHGECGAMCDADPACKAWTYVPPKWSTPYALRGAACLLRSGLSSRDGSRSGFADSLWVDGMFSGEKGAQQRSVVLRRALKGATPDYFSFDPTATGVPFINAVGTTPDFQYHGKTRGGSTVMLLEAGAPACVCRGNKTTGSINGLPWQDNCMPYPATTIMRDHNPSCGITTYGGGMMCCHHGVHLLDADQEVPTETNTVRMRFRVYYEDIVPNVTRAAFFMFRETEQNHGEYDVTRCPDGTPPEQCVHTIVGNFQVKDAISPAKDRSDMWGAPYAGKFPQSDKIKLLHASLHCHGPACISMRLVNADTNETLCEVRPVYGRGDAAMDEAGYMVGLPPCIWGSAEEGMREPPLLSWDTNLTSIKEANSSIYHYGVMAHLQMRAAWADGPTGGPTA